MVDHLPAPSRTKKRKSNQSEVSPTTSQNRPTKKAKTGGGSFANGTVVSSPVARPVQRIVKRIPTSKAKNRNAAASTLELNLDSDLDSLFDSEHSEPPIGIIKKKRTTNKPKPKLSIVPAIVKHLGAIELSDSSEDEPPPKPIPKRVQRVSPLKIVSTDIIDLCSDDEKDVLAIPLRSKAISKPMVVLSSEDEVEYTQLAPTSDIHSQKEAFTEIVPPQIFGADNTINHASSPSASPETPEAVSLDALQASYAAAMDRWNAKPFVVRRRPFKSKFGASTYKPPVREIVFCDDLPIVDLLTPGFFTRVIKDTTTKLIIAHKRAKKKRKMNNDATPPDLPAVPSSPALSLVPNKPLDQTSPAVILVESKTVSDSRRFLNAIRAKRGASRKTVVPNEVAPSSPSISHLPSATAQNSSSRQPSPATGVSLAKSHTTATPQTTPQPILDEISNLTLSSLLEAFNNDDDNDDNDSLSGLDFSYPSENNAASEGV